MARRQRNPGQETRFFEKTGFLAGPTRPANQDFEDLNISRAVGHNCAVQRGALHISQIQIGPYQISL